MIYFSYNFMKFPCHFNSKSSKIILTNEMTGDKNEIEFVDHSDEGRYYLIDLSNLELMNGTYEYSIGKDLGLLQVGDYIKQVTEYNEKKTNKVYER